MRNGLSLAVVSLFVAGSVGAQASRTWVSGVGNDADPCSRTAPCKTFAGAISKTAPKGEINIIDAGGFGVVTITKSISIVGEGATAGILASGTNGIIINTAATDSIVLKGLDIEGFGTGLNGIRVLSASRVIVEDCTINGFTQRGIDVLPSANPVTVIVKDTEVRNAGGGGIVAQGTAAALVKLFLNNVRLERNAGGLVANDFTSADVRDSAAVGNTGIGFRAISAANQLVSLNLENSATSLNGQGLRSDGTQTTLRISNTLITNNTTGIVASTGAVLSFGNNKNSGNGSNGVPTGLISQQ